MSFPFGAGSRALRGRRGPGCLPGVPRSPALGAAAALVLASAGPASAVMPAIGPPPVAVTSPAPSWTAEVPVPVVARRAPRPGGAVAMRLRPYTAFSRRPQALMVTGSAVDPRGDGWVRVALPRRPNGSQGWVRTAEVTLVPVTGRVRVLLGARRVEFWSRGRRVMSVRAAVGAAATPTPTGRFAVQDPVVTAPGRRAAYGPFIITLTAWSTVLTDFMGGGGLIAVHGAGTAATLGRAVTHGCVRLSDAAVARLAGLVAPGTPVDVVP